MQTSFTSLKIRSDTPERLLIQLAMSPLIYMRLAAILFAIIVFGCMADKGFINTPENDYCVLHNSGACNFAIAIGVLAFIICLAFFVKDVIMVIVDFSTSIIFKKILIVADMSVTGLWAFFWFVSFCYSADMRRKVDLGGGSIQSCMNATLAFSFFSIILWIAIIAVNGLFLFWILKGTDRDSRPSNNYTQHDNEGDFDDKVNEIASPPSAPPPTNPTQYTPPEY